MATDLPLRNLPPSERPLRDADSLNDNSWERRVHDAKRWHLLVEETVESSSLSEGDRIYGQFTPQQFTYDLSSNIAEGGGYSRENPLIHWLGGAVETITFQARLFSEHRDDDTAANKFKTLKELRKSLPPNNRPPLTRFFWGNAIPGGVQCFVQSLGGVQFDETREDGSIRGLTLNITLKKYTPFRIERAVVPAMEQTPMYLVRNATSYEMIAQLKWGDPMLGVLLRRDNPRFPMEKWAPTGLADLKSGERIKIYDKSQLSRRRIKPTSHIFDEDDVLSAENRRYFFSMRGRKISVLPKR